MIHRTTVHHRGSALLTAMMVLFVVIFIGAGLLSLGMQASLRGEHDALRSRALSLAEGGAEVALKYLRTRAPNGTTDGSWRVQNWTETVNGQGEFTLNVQDGTMDNDGRVVIVSTGRAVDGGYTRTRTVRVVAKITHEDVSVWNNSIFGGVGQAGRSINGNVQVRGNVHLLGDGEDYTDVDVDGRWDAGEGYTDQNGNGSYDLGEPYSDTDGDGHRDAREPWDDVNGNGLRDPELTVTDMGSEYGGTAAIGNNYSGMPSLLRNTLPPIPTPRFKGELVESLGAKLRVKHGRVDINGTAAVGQPHMTGGYPPVKETMDGVYVSDGFGGNTGASGVHSDNGHKTRYTLGDLVEFPRLTAPTVKNGINYPSYMEYLRQTGLEITGPLTITPGTAYGPISDGRGNSLSVDALGNITIRGIIYVNGDIKVARNGGSKSMRYTGRGTLVSTGTTYVSTDLMPATGTFPITQALGVIARRRIELATQGGDSQLLLTGAFYAQEQIMSQKQNELAGTFVTSHFSMQNVPHMYQVPTLPDNLPPGMPGSERIWINTVEIQSWREM